MKSKIIIQKKNRHSDNCLVSRHRNGFYNISGGNIFGSKFDELILINKKKYGYLFVR